MDPVTLAVAAIKKAGAEAAHFLITGPGPGAGSVEKPIKTSRVPGLERRKQVIEGDDVERFAREVLKRAAKTDPSLQQLSDEDRTLLAHTAGMMVHGLTPAVIDMNLVLSLNLDPARLGELLYTVGTNDLPEERLQPVLRAVVGTTCEHVVEFFSRRESFTTAAVMKLTQDQERKFAPGEIVELRADYSTQVRRKFQHMRLFGLDILHTDQNFDLATGFVDLSIEASGIRQRSGLPDRGRIGWDQIDVLVRERHRVLLEGPAGSGKSTLMQRLTLHYLDSAPDEPQILPFLIRLREFVADNALTLPPPNAFISTLTRPLAGRLPGWEHALLRDGLAAVLVDGVDEIPEHLRREALDWLAEIVAAYPLALYVITSRPSAVEESWREDLRGQDFTTASINPMSNQQVETFIDHWHDAAALQPSADLEDLHACAEDLNRSPMSPGSRPCPVSPPSSSPRAPTSTRRCWRRCRT